MWHVFNSEEINVHYELKLYGSSFTGLTIKGDGDLDYSVILPDNKDLSRDEILNYLAKGVNGKTAYKSEVVSFTAPRH